MIRLIQLTDAIDQLIARAAAEIAATPEDFIAATFRDHAGRLAVMTPSARTVVTMPRPESAHELEERIRRALSAGPKTRAEIGRRISNRPAVEIEAALAALILAGKVRRMRTESGARGRPAHIFALASK